MSSASISFWSRRVANGTRRSGSVAATLFGLLLLTFFIGRVMPLDPVLAIVGPDGTQTPPPTPRPIRNWAWTSR